MFSAIFMWYVISLSFTKFFISIHASDINSFSLVLYNSFRLQKHDFSSFTVYESTNLADRSYTVWALRRRRWRLLSPSSSSSPASAGAAAAAAAPGGGVASCGPTPVLLVHHFACSPAPNNPQSLSAKQTAHQTRYDHAHIYPTDSILKKIWYYSIAICEL